MRTDKIMTYAGDIEENLNNIKAYLDMSKKSNSLDFLHENLEEIEIKINNCLYYLERLYDAV